MIKKTYYRVISTYTDYSAHAILADKVERYKKPENSMIFEDEQDIYIDYFDTEEKALKHIDSVNYS